VCIAHEDVTAAGGGDAGLQGRTIAPSRGENHAGAGGLGERRGGVGAGIVGDQYFAAYIEALEGGERLVHANRNGTGLIKARHEHGYLALLPLVKRSNVTRPHGTPVGGSETKPEAGSPRGLACSCWFPNARRCSPTDRSTALQSMPKAKG